MIHIFTSVVNRVDFVIIQNKLFQKFLKDNYQFHIVDDSVDLNISNQFESICIENNFLYYKKPERTLQMNPAQACADTVQWTYDNIIRKNHLDDIILAKPGQIIHSLIDKLTTIIIKKKYCIEKILVNMGTITNILMILVDKYNYLSGIEKKIIVIESINTFIKERLEYIIDLNENNKKELIMVLDSIPLSIDLFITLQKGKYEINKKDKKEEYDDDIEYKTTFFFFKKKIISKNKYDF